MTQAVQPVVLGFSDFELKPHDVSDLSGDDQTGWSASSVLFVMLDTQARPSWPTSGEWVFKVVVVGIFAESLIDAQKRSYGGLQG